MAIERTIEQLFQKQAEKFNEGQGRAVRAEGFFSEPDYGRFAAYSFGLTSLLKPWRFSPLFRVTHTENSAFPATLKPSDQDGEHVVSSADHLAAEIEKLMQSKFVEEPITELLR